MTVHLAMKIRFRTIAACGRWAIEHTTERENDVTCKVCRRIIAREQRRATPTPSQEKDR